MNHSIERVTRAGCVVELGDRPLGIERGHPRRERRPVKALPVLVAHVEIAEALRVALSPLERCEVLEPLQTVAEAAVPGAAGKAGDRRPEDTASHDGRQQRIGADVTITPVSVIAAEQLIAAVAA